MSTQAQPELELIQGRNERSITVNVTERVIAVDGDTKKEVEKAKAVFVRPMPFRRWPQALAHLSGVIKALPSVDLDLNNLTTIGFLAAHLIGNANDSIFAVLELATDEDGEFFDRIDLDDGVRITQAVIEVNKDFFVQKVLPLVSEIAPALKDKLTPMSTSGQTQ